MVHAICLGVVLYAGWLLLSGHDGLLLLALGALSCIGIVAIALRMDTVDQEGHPVHLSWRAPVYWAWLAWQIVKANVDVARRILNPRLDISPTLIKVRGSQRDDVGRVTYANAITLTPGTVSIDIVGREITVHAISREAADQLARGEMDRRASAMAGSDDSIREAE